MTADSTPRMAWDCMRTGKRPQTLSLQWMDPTGFIDPARRPSRVTPRCPLARRPPRQARVGEPLNDAHAPELHCDCRLRLLPRDLAADQALGQGHLLVGERVTYRGDSGTVFGQLILDLLGGHLHASTMRGTQRTDIRKSVTNRPRRGNAARDLRRRETRARSRGDGREKVSGCHQGNDEATCRECGPLTLSGRQTSVR